MKTLCAFMVLLLVSCVSIPTETITLSKTLGKDLKTLKQSHLNTIHIYYDNLESKVNRFVDEVYSPFIIQFVLESEFESYEAGKASIVTSLRQASNQGATQADTDQALQAMIDFQTYATEQIAQKRNELLQPLQSQKMEIIETINTSYDNAITANATLTGYLASVKDVEQAQTESLSIIGIDRARVDERLLETSELLDEVIARGRTFDLQAEDALSRINELIEEIKRLTNR